jgi:ubiquinone/menaquinone biosynthesis C-methylase UbiE
MTLPAYAMSHASFPEMYEQALVGPLFEPWVAELFQRIHLQAGERLLDVATGTGIVARLALERVGDRGRVVAVDLSPQMLAVARAIAPGVDWREGSAGALPVSGDERFDVVLCQQGLQFFPDKPAAVREMRRVLGPAGRVAIATWRSVEEFPLLRALNAVAERHVGAITDARYGFGDAAALARLLEGAGFHDVQVETMSRTIRFAEPETFVRLNAMALVGMSGASAAMSPEQRAQMAHTIATDSASVLPPYVDSGGLAFDISTNVATGRC